uniref:Uncharacterized protein n=1 Tax=Oryza glumipatula TaxID=40148 RepID=A0A0E0AK47_9ORYZ
MLRACVACSCCLRHLHVHQPPRRRRRARASRQLGQVRHSPPLRRRCLLRLRGGGTGAGVAARRRGRSLLRRLGGTIQLAVPRRALQGPRRLRHGRALPGAVGEAPPRERRDVLRGAVRVPPRESRVGEPREPPGARGVAARPVDELLVGAWPAPVEGAVAGEELEQHDAEAPDVAPRREAARLHIECK